METKINTTSLIISFKDGNIPTHLKVGEIKSMDDEFKFEIAKEGVRSYSKTIIISLKVLTGNILKATRRSNLTLHTSLYAKIRGASISLEVNGSFQWIVVNIQPPLLNFDIPSEQLSPKETIREDEKRVCPILGE